MRSHTARKVRSKEHKDQALVVKALLEQEYDERIMAEILNQPKIKAYLAEVGPIDDEQMRLVKGSLVLFGTYEQYVNARGGK